MWSDVFPHFAHLQACATDLPFSVGGIVQPGRYPQPGNNQDAVGVDVGRDAVIAFISDGCASNAPTSRNAKSINEVGANVAVVLAIGMARRLIAEPRSLDNPGAFVSAFSERYAKSLWHLACHLAQARVFGRDMRAHIILDFLTSTLLGVILTSRRLVILGKGDGVVVVNGEEISLVGGAGAYPLNEVIESSTLGKPPCFANGLGLIHHAETALVRHVMLASDGFCDFPAKASLQSLISRPPAIARRGYDGRFFREFRADVAAGLENEGFHDDRSLVLIRRVCAQEEDGHHA